MVPIAELGPLRDFLSPLVPSAQVVSSDGSVSSTAEQSKAVGSHKVWSCVVPC